MKSEKLEVVRGSGNVFRDLRHENADVQQFKAILAAEIIKTLDRERLTVRAAHGRTGIAAADFSRIRNADLGRFTVDRLISIINRLGSRVEVKVRCITLKQSRKRRGSEGSEAGGRVIWAGGDSKGGIIGSETIQSTSRPWRSLNRS